MPGLSAIAKNLFFKFGVYNGMRRFVPNPQVSILRYHAIVSPQDNSYTSPAIALSLDQFEAHVAFFSEYYNVISLDYVIDCLQHNQTLPASSVVFTFDDGYADNFQAAQILEKYGASGTFYLTTEPISRKENLWLMEVTHLILKTTRKELRIIHTGEKQTYALSDSNSRWKAIRDIIRIIKSNNLIVRQTIRKQLLDQLGQKALLREIEKLMLTWDEVKQMQDMGMTIGAHTTTHLNLPNAAPQDAVEEIVVARQVLESKLKRPVRHFSYPNSGPYEYFNERIREYVVEAGYESATTSATGFVGRDSDRFALKRVRTVPQLEEVVHGMEWDRLMNEK